MSNEAIVLLAIAAFAAGMAVYHYLVPHNPER